MLLNCWHPGFQLDHSCKCKHAVYIRGNEHCGVLIGILKWVILVELADTQSVSVGDHTSQLLLSFLTSFWLTQLGVWGGDEAGGRKCWLQLKKASGQVRLAKKDCSMKLFSVCAYSRHAERLPSSCVFSNKNGMFYLLEQVSVVYKNSAAPKAVLYFDQFQVEQT